ncbi:MAG TPA: hypothetical protein VKU85_01150 [bacterium]|nr:hypothetical protein [bacterium]
MATTDARAATDEKASAQLRDQVETLKEDVGQTAQLAKTAAAESLEDAKEKAREYVQTGREKKEHYEDALLTRVRERPLQSVAIAAGVGLVIGLLGRR